MNNPDESHENPSLPLTALILTYNEEANIVRTLRSLDWISRIIVIDSGSTDGTLSLLSGFHSVNVIHRAFDTFARQCNFGLENVSTPWVLSLDADYRISPELASEIRALFSRPMDPSVVGFTTPFQYCIGGRPVRGTLLPPRTCLYQVKRARYHDEGHGHRVVIRGRTKSLHAPILHDDRKPIGRWLRSQYQYMVIEAANLRAASYQQLSWADRLRRQTPLAPLAALFLCLVWKGGMLDGWRGWFYALQRMYAELLLLLLLMDARLRAGNNSSATSG